MSYGRDYLSPDPRRGEEMSDEEHHFEARGTYTQAGTIHRDGYIVIADRPCKVVEVSTFETGGYASCHFVAIDIFTWARFEHSVSSSHNCYVPLVNRIDYQLIDISEDGHLSLLTENGNIRDDLVLPANKWLRNQIKDGFSDGKVLVLTVMSAMGEEQICALKYVGPKN